MEKQVIHFCASSTNLKGTQATNIILHRILYQTSCRDQYSPLKPYRSIQLTINYLFCANVPFVKQLFCMSGQRKYQKINKQIKFQFLDKVLRQGLPVYEVAQQIGIRYSTAKTIVFFQKNSHKSYRSFNLQPNTSKQSTNRAHYREIQQEEKGCISIITNKKFMCWQPRKEVKSRGIELTYLRNNDKREVRRHVIGKRFSSPKIVQKRNGVCFSKTVHEEDSVSDSQYLGTE